LALPPTSAVNGDVALDFDEVLVFHEILTDFQLKVPTAIKERAIALSAGVEMGVRYAVTMTHANDHTDFYVHLEEQAETLALLERQMKDFYQNVSHYQTAQVLMAH